MSKIIVADNSVYITGAIKSLVALIGRHSRDPQFEFAMDRRGEAARYVIESGYKVHDVRYLEISRSWHSVIYPAVLVVNAYRLSQLARCTNARILHINDLYNLTGLLAKFFNRNLVVVYHVRLTRESYIKPIYSALAWFLRRWADAIVCVSRAAGASFVDMPKATLVYDALASPPIHPARKIDRVLLDCRYLCVGNYVRGKGQNLVLEAFAQIASRLPAATLRCVGNGAFGELDGQYVAELKTRVAQVGLIDRVSFDGPVSDVEKAMKDADVVVNLSESESFSMVCLEALTYGMPLVVSDCGGPCEIVENDVNGLLVENRNIGQAAEAMFRIAAEPDLAQKFAAAGPQSATEKFSLQKSAEKLSAIYSTLLERTKA